MKNVKISDEHQAYLKKIKNYQLMLTTARISILIFFIVLWELAAIMGWIDPFLTSSPSRIIKSLISFYNEGILFKHIAITCFETIVGFVLGTLIGTIIAMLLWWSDFISKVFDPYLVVLNALPKVALGPIIIFWAGNGMTSIIVMALLISIIVTVISVLSGFKSVDEDKIKLLKTFKVLFVKE